MRFSEGNIFNRGGKVKLEDNFALCYGRVQLSFHSFCIQKGAAFKVVSERVLNILSFNKQIKCIELFVGIHTGIKSSAYG